MAERYFLFLVIVAMGTFLCMMVLVNIEDTLLERRMRAKDGGDPQIEQDRAESASADARRDVNDLAGRFAA